MADVSAVADPSTGVWVYNTYGSSRSWQIYGGTSAAAPIIGALYALAANPRPASSQLASYPYANPSALNDVVSGTNGFCFGSYPLYRGRRLRRPHRAGNAQHRGGLQRHRRPATTAPPAPTPADFRARPAPKSGGHDRRPRHPPHLERPLATGGSAVTKYKLFRGFSASGESLFVTVACSAATCSYTDTTTSRRITYCYRAAAVNATTTGPFSNHASARAG